MKLRSDLLLLPLDDDVVVFSEQAQCLVGLNASAAAIVERLQTGLSSADIARHLVSEGACEADAEGWVQNVVEALAAQDMVDGPRRRAPSASESEVTSGPELAKRVAEMPAYAPFEPVAVRHYRLLNTCAEIRFGHLRQLPWVDSVIGHLAVEQPQAATLRIDIPAVQGPTSVRSYVYRDGERVDFASGLFRLGPIVKGAFWQAAVNAYDFRFYVHAGVVGSGSSCMLLPAAAGSGKSSLTAALAHKGFRYFSDEVALLEPGTFAVPPAPLAFCVKKTGWPVIARYFPQIADTPIHQRMDRRVVRYLAPTACGLDVAQKSAPVSHIILPRYMKDAETAIKPVGRSEALRHLMVECLALRQRLTPQNVAALVRWISAIPCYSLIFSSLEQAVDLIESVMSNDPQQEMVD
jgi:hypothetical protein